MTTLEACSNLHKWFFEHDSFCVEDNLKELVLIAEDSSQVKASVICGLKEFERLGLVDYQNSDGKNYYILKKHFGSYEQSVTMSAGLAALIADTINDYCDASKDEGKRCNPLEIKEKDLAFLLYYAGEILQNNSKGKK